MTFGQLSKFHFVYQKNYGFRVSAAGWYDAAYDDKVEGNNYSSESADK